MTSKCALSFYGFALWIVFNYAFFCGSEAALTTYYVEDLCGGWTQAQIDLHRSNTGMLASLSTGGHDDFGECSIRLKPGFGSSVVLSVYRYNLGPHDQLIIEDSDKFRVALIGEGDFSDERKSFQSDGIMTLHYTKNSSSLSGSRMKFQFVFTQVNKDQCGFDEFKCRNNNCIRKNLVCDRHNHCGDNSDQVDCGPREVFVKTPDVARVKTFPALGIAIIISSVVLGIIVIVFAAFLIRGLVRRRKQAAAKNSAGALPTVAAAVPQHTEVPTAPPADPQVAPSILHRIRTSFRGMRRPQATAQEPTKPEENYQVPSMYPQLPAAPHVPSTAKEPKTGENYQVPPMYPQVPAAPHVPSTAAHFQGVDNPEFKEDD